MTLTTQHRRLLIAAVGIQVGGCLLGWVLAWLNIRWLELKKTLGRVTA